ncbi:hypothetical protein TWF173_003104 [Orbilia oligospora]|nr:hypothetical protein TWF173_003104 [Orbilia oligospora]
MYCEFATTCKYFVKSGMALSEKINSLAPSQNPLSSAVLAWEEHAQENIRTSLTFDKKRGYCQQVPTGDTQMLTEKVALGSFEKQLRELPKAQISLVNKYRISRDSTR